uniref:Ovule protein n=1 Tax=Ascaris lumbricoides TaxID=6252 RepID=A0A0M3I9K7_ASCLU
MKYERLKLPHSFFQLQCICDLHLVHCHLLNTFLICLSVYLFISIFIYSKFNSIIRRNWHLSYCIYIIPCNINDIQ